MIALVHTWFRWVDSKYPSSNFATTVGVERIPDAAASSIVDTTFDLPQLSQGPFKVGEQLVVTHRFSTSVPLQSQPDFHCDIQKGTEAFVTNVDLLDAEGKITVRIAKNIKDKLTTFTAVTKSEYFARPSSMGEEEKKRAAEKKKVKKDAAPKDTPVDAAPAWTNRSVPDPKTGVQNDLSRATVNKTWASHVKFDKDLEVTVAKHWATASMAMLSSTVPTYSAQSDLLVVERNNGLMREVWTRRDFKKHELIFAPVSSVIKDHYWTRGRSVLLKGGSKLHPSHKHFVMEQQRMTTVPAGPAAGAGSDDYTFSLFWAVERTNDKSEANLVLEYPKRWSRRPSCSRMGRSPSRRTRVTRRLWCHQSS